MAQAQPASPLLQRFPLLLPVGSMACGIAVGLHTEACLSSGWWLAFACLFVGLWATQVRRNYIVKSDVRVRQLLQRERRNRLAGFALASLAIGCSGAALGTIGLERVKTLWPSQRLVWKARITGVNRAYADSYQVDARIITPEAYQGKTVRFNLQREGSGEIEIGQNFTCQARVKAPHNAGNPCEFDRRRYLLTHGISGTAWCDRTRWRCGQDEAPTAPMSALRSYFRSVRCRMVRAYARHFSDDTFAVLSALTLGDKSMLSATTHQLYAEAGASHVLALSGLHLSILFGLYMWALRRWCHRRWVMAAASVPGLMALWAFVLMSGESLSLVRAATMMTLLLVFNCLRQRIPLVHNLCLCALLMLAAHPLTLFDVGFQMSFAAITGIALFNECVRPHIRCLNEEEVWMPVPLRASYLSTRVWVKHLLKHHLHGLWQTVCRWAREMFFVSLSAQVFTLPLVVYYFHIVATYGVLSSYWVIPLATGILALSVLFFLLPFAQSAIAPLLQWLISLMQHGLQAISALPGAAFHVYLTLPAILAGSLGIVLLIRWKLTRLSRPLHAAMLAFAAAIGLTLFDLRPQNVAPQIQVYNAGSVTAVHFISSAHRSYLLSSANADSTRRALQFVGETFWKVRHMSPPVPLAPHARHEEIVREGDRMAFGPVSIVWMHTTGCRGRGRRPARVDLLILSKGCTRGAGDILREVVPRRVAITSDVPPWQAQPLAAEFESAGIRTSVGACSFKLSDFR